MRPPMTAAKNDGISPQNWKTVLVQQKEVLVVNNKNKSQLQQQQQQQQQHQQQEQQQNHQRSSNNDHSVGDNKLINEDLNKDFNNFTETLVNSLTTGIATTGTVTTVSTTTTTTTTTTTAATTSTIKSKHSPILKIVSEQLQQHTNNHRNQSKQLLKKSNSNSEQQQQQQQPNLLYSSNNINKLLSFPITTRNHNNNYNTNNININNNNNNDSVSNNVNINVNNSKLKRISSDVSDNRQLNINKPQLISRNGSSSCLITFSKSNNLNNNNNVNNKININNKNKIQTTSSSTSSINVNNCSSNLDEVPQKLQQQYTKNNTKLLKSSSSSLSNSCVDTTSIVTLPIIKTTKTTDTEPLLLSSNIECELESNDILIDSSIKRSICLTKNSASTFIFTKKDLSCMVSCNNNNNNNTITASDNKNKSDKIINLLYNSDLNISNTANNIHLRTTCGANNIVNNTNNSNNNNNNSSNSNSSNSSCSSSNISKHHNIDVQKLSCDGIGNIENKENFLQRRRSLQINYSNICRDTIGNYRQTTNSTTATNNRKQHAYSWYAPVYSALEEEIEQDSRDSSPIHSVPSTKSSLENEKVSLLGKNQSNVQPQLHQSQIRRPGTICQTPSIAIGNGGIVGNQTYCNKNDVDDGPQDISLLGSGGGSIPRKKRIENFFKSLVGRKPLREPLATTINNTNINNNGNSTNVPILQSPEITITRTPSEQHLQREVVAAGGSTTSLNSVQQKLWNVVPLLKREGSTTSLYPNKADSIVHYTGMRKCETVLALTRQSSVNGSVEQIKPLNRLRNSLSTSNATCSRCSSLLSLAASGSRYSLNVTNSGFISVNNSPDSKINSATTSGFTIAPTVVDGGSAKDSINSSNNGLTVKKTISTFESITCKLCLSDVKMNAVTTIGQCGCSFCTECMTTYVELEISEGAYEISCPDAQCPSQGILTLAEIAFLASPNLVKKHHRYRLNREIELDKNRTWCPRAGCETVCHVGGGIGEPSSSSSSSTFNNEDKVNSIIQVLCAVQCPTCKEEFCSGCKKPWHPNVSCEENNRRLIADGQENRVGIPFDNDLIKCCPMCAVPIEKDEGCAQMMCKRCKHVFCWYCLASLDDDFLLRHYDKGPCKNKLGHSRASVVWHRAQVIGIFAGFGILLLVASPLLLLAAPCIICCKCRICNGTTKLEDADTEFDEAVALQR